jgi:hypothetical protein
MHIYELNGNKYPSVTTILKLISIDDGLLKWANYVGLIKRKNIKEIQDEATNFGTLVHSNIRCMVDKNAPPPEPFLDPRKEYDYSIVKKKFVEYFKDIKYRTIGTEMTLISDKLGYGGTLDWLAQIEIDNRDKLFLLDFKTNKTIRDTMYLQLGGYYYLLTEIGITVDYAGIVIVNERECGIHPISKDILIKYADAFISILEFYTLWEKLNKVKPEYDIITLLKKQPDKLHID